MSIAEEVSSSDFLFDELFFSRTDKKGIIQSGNSVFQRISEFEWDEILNRPHRVVRHPHMPRGIFHLMWNEILSDHMIGAKIETAKIKTKSEDIISLINQLSVFKDSLKNGLREIEEYGLNLSKQTEEMSTLLEKEA